MAPETEREGLAPATELAAVPGAGRVHGGRTALGTETFLAAAAVTAMHLEAAPEAIADQVPDLAAAVAPPAWDLEVGVAAVGEDGAGESGPCAQRLSWRAQA